MKHLIRAVTAAFLALLPALAAAQTFPSVPANTVIGRLGVGTGPSQAIPFATFLQSLQGNQSANTVSAGPTSGGPAKPTFRPLVAADVPVLPNTNLANPATTVNGVTCTLGSSCTPPVAAGLWQISNNAATNVGTFSTLQVFMTADFVTLYSPSLGTSKTVNGPVSTQNSINSFAQAGGQDSGVAATVTITIASPGVVSWTAHGLSAGSAVVFSTSGALPTGIAPGTVYYVIAAGLTTNSFEISATKGGSAINTSGSQSGTQTGTKNVFGMGDTVWFYYIWGSGPGINTISSKNAPATGPTLPTGYTHYAPAFVFLISSGGNLRPSCGLCGTTTTWHVAGNSLWLDTSNVVDYTAIAINGGVPTSIDLSAIYPLGTSKVNLQLDVEAHNGAAALIGGFVFEWSAIGQNDINLSLYAFVNTTIAVMETVVEFPLNSNRNVWAQYLTSSGTITSQDLTIFYRGWSWAN